MCNVHAWYSMLKVCSLHVYSQVQCMYVDPYSKLYIGQQGTTVISDNTIQCSELQYSIAISVNN